MARGCLTILLAIVGTYLVGAFLSGVADDPCDDRDGGAEAVALFLGVLALGVVAYLVAGRWTSRPWIHVVALIGTTVGGFLLIATFGFLAYWVPNCAN